MMDHVIADPVRRLCWPLSVVRRSSPARPTFGVISRSASPVGERGDELRLAEELSKPSEAAIDALASAYPDTITTFSSGWRL